MCKPFSCIITKNQTIYIHPNPLEHSHTEIMKHYNLKESIRNACFNSFVKIEIFPLFYKYLSTPVHEWKIIVDETEIPQWYEDDKESFETIIRKEAQSWLNKIKEIDWSKATPFECYYYARDVLKGPFPLGEKAIATIANYSYWYASNILEGRFTLGEKSIATSADYSYLYARDVLKGPFKLGEKSIATDAYYSYLYANILKGPFPLGEKVIATDAEYSYYYAQNILEGRFILGEKSIATSAHYSYFYAREVLRKRFPLGEKAIQKDQRESKAYLENIIKPNEKDLQVINKHQRKMKKTTFYSLIAALDNLNPTLIVKILTQNTQK